MLCPNCGNFCQETASFCIHCGTRLPKAPNSPAPESPVCSPVTPQPRPAPHPHRTPAWILLALSLLGLLLFFAISPTTGEIGASEAPWFRIDESGTVYFIPEAYDGDGTVILPQSLDGITVRHLGEQAFAGSDAATVILPDSLETIGDSAFSGCTSLRGIFLPQGVTTIGPNAFAGCSSLEAICVPGTVQEIGSRAFFACSDLRFVFYAGYIQGWNTLYAEFINPSVCVICVDGYFQPGENTP